MSRKIGICYSYEGRKELHYGNNIAGDYMAFFTEMLGGYVTSRKQLSDGSWCIELILPEGVRKDIVDDIVYKGSNHFLEMYNL